MRRRLIVSGDDFGAAAEVNAAIVRAHREGILTSASLMITGGAAGEAVALARANPSLAVGLHLVLAQGRPAATAADVRLLVRGDGSFGDQPVLAGLRYALAWLGRVGRTQLRREIEAQFEAFVATGLRPTHVDGHLNMHLHPMVLPTLVELAPRWGVRALRLSRDPLWPALRFDPRHTPRKLAEGSIFHALSAWAAPRLAKAGIATTDRVFGLHQSGHVDERYLLALLRTLPPGASEVYLHPSDRAAPALAGYQRGYDPEGELAALLSPRVRNALAAAGVDLIDYRDL